MPKRIDTSSYDSLTSITERLDQIVTQVRRKDVPLESSLDLFDEAIALGSKAVDFVDTAEVEPSEAAQVKAEQATDNAETHEDGQEDGTPQA